MLELDLIAIKKTFLLKSAYTVNNLEKKLERPAEFYYRL